MKNKKSIFYGWILVVSTLIIISIVYGVLCNTSGLFIKHISIELEISRSLVSFQMTLITLTFAITSILDGSIIKKIGIRKTMIIGSILSSMSIIGFSSIKSLLSLYIFSVIGGAGLGLTTLVPINILLSNWFEKKRGLVTGIVLSGTGIGGLLATKLINFIINTCNWRIAYLVMGLICLVIVVPITIFFIKEYPKDLNQLPYGKSKNREIKLKDNGYMLKEIKYTKYFISLLIGVFLINFICTGFVSHLNAYLTDIGYSYDFSANVISIYWIGLIFSKLIIGNILDRFGGRKTFFIGSTSFVIGFLLCAFFKDEISCLSFAVIISIGSSLGTVGLPFLTKDLYGENDYANILGVLTFSEMLGGAVGAPFSGMIYDLLGSYMLWWIISMFLGGTIYILVRYSYKFTMCKNI